MRSAFAGSLSVIEHHLQFLPPAAAVGDHGNKLCARSLESRSSVRHSTPHSLRGSQRTDLQLDPGLFVS